jgi:hypothetical protein
LSYYSANPKIQKILIQTNAAYFGRNQAKHGGLVQLQGHSKYLQLQGPSANAVGQLFAVRGSAWFAG